MSADFLDDAAELTEKMTAINIDAVRKEGWVRVYMSEGSEAFSGAKIYETKERAQAAMVTENFLCAARIEWEE